MAISSLGVGSNLDLNSIVEGLMAAEQAPLNLVAKQQATYQTKISAYGTIKSSLGVFQDAVAKLSSIAKFTTQSATSSDSKAFTASADGKAVESSYAVTVRQLAQSQKLATAGSASPSTVIGTGTLTISFGSYDSTGNTFTLNEDKPAKSITISPANNTLAGIRDAINSADAGVMASIVNDGTLNRLVITGKETGSSNSIKIAVADGDGDNTNGSGLSQLAFDPTLASGSGENLSVLQGALDAIVDIDGVRVTKSSNSISDALDGITLNLLKADVSTSLSLTVKRDQAAIESSVNAFVKAYNDVNQTLRKLTNYDLATQTGGALVGDSAARSIGNQIKQVMTSALAGAGDLNSLTQIGVSFQRDGTLALDSSKLKAALADNPGGIAHLFAAAGKPSDLQVSHTGQTTKTRAGVYDVNISRLATQGGLLGNAAPDLDIVEGVNDALEIKVDGKLYSIKLGAASYASAQALADELQTRLSAAGASVKTQVSGGNLQLVSSSYGASSSITLQGGNGSDNVFGASPVSTAGLDVAGTINGVAATGKGQTLVGATGNASEGLALKIAGGSTGARGTVSYTTGYAYQLEQLAKSLLSDTGVLETRTDGLNDSVKRLSRQKEALEDRLLLIEKRYRAQFTALDVLISNMQQTSSYMTQQLAQLSANNQ